jgi:hypothetical protein
MFSLINGNEQINRFKSIIDNNHNGKTFENKQRLTTRLQGLVNRFLFFRRQIALSMHISFFFRRQNLSL